MEKQLTLDSLIEKPVSRCAVLAHIYDRKKDGDVPPGHTLFIYDDGRRQLVSNTKLDKEDGLN